MIHSQTEDTSIGQITVTRGKVDSLSIYEVTDNELEILEKGSPSSIYLNFSLFLLSTGFSFLTIVLTIDITSIKIFTSFVLIGIIGIILGVVLLALWYRESNSNTTSEVIKKIKNRIPNCETLKENEHD
jgi:hypothetical protein